MSNKTNKIQDSLYNKNKLIPTYVLSGFLGSGKTTLLLELLKYVRENGRKAAILVNDFGEVNIDGALLTGEGFNVLELTDGCICCQIGEDLVQAFTEVAKRNPEMIFVEATGLADPVDLLDQATVPHLLKLINIEKIVTIADPKNFPRLSKILKIIVKRQTQFADIVIISKMDEATEDQINEIKNYVAEVNPHTQILFANNGIILGDEHHSWLFSTNNTENSEAKRSIMRDALESHEHHIHRDFHTFSSKLINPLNKSKFEYFMRNLPAEILRAKGFVRFMDDQNLWVAMYVNGDFYLRQANLSPPPTEHLVFIGSQIDEQFITTGITNCYEQ